jgi:hypothetical protein
LSWSRRGRVLRSDKPAQTFSADAGSAGVGEGRDDRAAFKRYGDWAGLAFWLYLTRGWVEDGLPV